MGERFLIYLFPALNWEFVHKIQTLTYYLGVPAILKFFHAVFSDLYNAKVVKLAGFSPVFHPAGYRHTGPRFQCN